MSAGPLDLSPRTAAPVRTRSRWIPIGVLVAIAVAIVVMVWFLITNSQSFLEADIAVAQRAEQGDQRFQLLGSPIADADDPIVVDGEEFTAFTVAFDGVRVDVISQGTPPDLFGAGVPVVLEGHWVEGPAPVDRFVGGANDGWWFSADRILPKHDDDYRNDRLDEADERGRVTTTRPDR